MTESFRTVENWADYQFDCPEGEWTARLDNKAWGRSANLILYFSEIGTDKKYWFSVFGSKNYRPDGEGLSFKTDVEVGEVLTLTTTKTKTGNPRLKAEFKAGESYL